MKDNLYWWYKSHNICPYCRINKAVKGKTSCLDCAELQAERWRNNPHRTSEQKEYMRIRQKKYRDLLVAFGVCQVCARKDAIQGHTMCLECLLKKNRRSKENRRKNGRVPVHFRYNSGICYFCLKKVDNGEIICSECKIKKSKCAKYARQFIGRNKLRAQKKFSFGKNNSK